MPLPANYFENRVKQSSQPQVGAGYSSNPQDATLQQKLDKANQQSAYYRAEASRPLWQRFGHEVLSSIWQEEAPTLQDMDEMNFGKFAKAVTWGTTKFAYRTAKSLPGAIIKAPMNLSLSLLNAESKLLDKWLGKGDASIPSSYKLPILGEVKSTAYYYDEGLAMGMSPLEATIKAGGETINDVAIGLMGAELGVALTKPRISTVKIPGQQKYVIGEDPLPLKTQFTKQTAKPGEAKIATGRSFEVKANKDITYTEVPRAIAEKVGGNQANTFFKRRPLNKEIAGINNPVEVSIVQVRPSVLDKARGLFNKNISRSKVSTGPYGPEVKLGSWIVDGNKAGQQPNVAVVPINSVKTGLMPALESKLNLSTEKILKYEDVYRSGLELKPIPVYEENGQFVLNKDGYHRFMAQKNIGAKEISVEIQPKTDLSASQKQLLDKTEPPFMTGAPMETSVALKSPVSKPLKGNEFDMLNSNQIQQLNYVKDSVEISDEMMSVMSRVLNGKSNIYDLNQQEAYELSEAMRTYPKGKDNKDFWSGFLLNKSYQQPTRAWADYIENTTGVPVATGVYYPIEKGMRLASIEFNRWRDMAREIFGEYADFKYYEDRRIIKDYIKSGGDKNVINNSKSLTPEMKKDFIKIGDWMNEQFKQIFPSLGMTSERWFGKYLPELEKSNGIINRYKDEDLPPELKPFFRYERQGMLNVAEDDPLALFDIYMKSYTREKYVNRAYERGLEIKDQLSSYPKMQKALDDYLKEKMGYQDSMMEDLNRFSQKIADNFPKIFHPGSMKKIVDDLTTLSYGGALAARPMAIIRNYAQMFLTVLPELGPEAFFEGYKRSQSSNIKKVDQRGFNVKMGVPYGSEISENITVSRNIPGLIWNKYNDLNKGLLTQYGKGDELARDIILNATEYLFEKNYNLLSEGKITQDQFLKNIDYYSFTPSVKKIIDSKLSENTKESLMDAVDLMVQEKIDKTVFPYRKGAESRLFYGLRGKTFFQFGQWVFEYMNTIGNNWVRNKEWMKLIRWWGMGAAMQRAAKEMGIDVSKWFGLKAAGGSFPLGPVARMMLSSFAAIDNFMQKNDDAFNQNIKELGDSLKLYGGVLTGVESQRIQNVIKSIDRHLAGVAPSIYPDKPFGIYSQVGKLKRWVSASGLMKYAFGFADQDEQTIFDNIGKMQFDYAVYKTRMNSAMNALIDGDYEKFDKIVSENELMVGDLSEKLKSYIIPLDQRIFERMPQELKIKYMPLLYPGQ